MISNYRPAYSRWAVILVSAAALTLGGCGRKGALDLPPNASASSSVPAEGDAERAASKPSVFNPSYGTDAPPLAAKGAKRAFILDPLLND